MVFSLGPTQTELLKPYDKEKLHTKWSTTSGHNHAREILNNNAQNSQEWDGNHHDKGKKLYD